MPREVCLDVGREFGAATNVFYKPPCVSVYRCGGCCNSEDLQCRNISTSYISKTVSYPGGEGVGILTSVKNLLMTLVWRISLKLRDAQYLYVKL